MPSPLPVSQVTPAHSWSRHRPSSDTLRAALPAWPAAGPLPTSLPVAFPGWDGGSRRPRRIDEPLGGQEPPGQPAVRSIAAPQAHRGSNLALQPPGAAGTPWMLWA
ncbi:DNA-directed RNA polymerases I, II, and III subunit RPABC5 isoform X3 [Echinops telfairi]|uniref:DNA-directed RNA polymerases I, II, and III subunit RPABC5 isoform X3 n=1 Tax=Echinops telfairi TaxID=9371 RepID=A0AC55D3S6_ECHTE|nr:DNA-directed RNA polymerases I, II, and III subunit RPABC5 isoform X3 [Echinops telfairi]